MAELRQLLVDLGFEDARTLLQTGNLVFDGGKHEDAALETLLEEHVQRRFGFQTEIMVRNAREWSAIIERNPYPEAARDDPSHMTVMVLKSAPPAETGPALQEAIVGRETVHLDGRQLYMVYPDGMGESKLTPAVITRKLGVRGTARNWNTVLKLAALTAGT